MVKQPANISVSTRASDASAGVAGVAGGHDASLSSPKHEPDQGGGVSAQSDKDAPPSPPPGAGSSRLAQRKLDQVSRRILEELVLEVLQQFYVSGRSMPTFSYCENLAEAISRLISSNTIESFLIYVVSDRAAAHSTLRYLAGVHLSSPTELAPQKKSEPQHEAERAFDQLAALAAYTVTRLERLRGATDPSLLSLTYEDLKGAFEQTKDMPVADHKHTFINLLQHINPKPQSVSNRAPSLYHFEVLKSVEVLGSEAYANAIARNLDTRLSETNDPRRVHATLRRLVDKGLLSSDVRNMVAQDGRSRDVSLYTLTVGGKQYLITHEPFFSAYYEKLQRQTS